MEYKELQIGDWVLTPWEVPIRVKNAHDNHIETEVKNGHTWSFGKNYHCSPIPLTPEILEKNGFKKLSTGMSTMMAILLFNIVYLIYGE